jgi:hypothetical protein
MPARKTPAAPAATPTSRARARPPWTRAARPDAIDFRDRWYVPRVAAAPPPVLFPASLLAVRNQGRTNACTGFALALVVEHLLKRAGREPDPAISSYMLYSMARRYDEFPGSVADEGSSLRGALKGWFRHGACREPLFPDIDMPPAAPRIEDDWWYDAVRRPLGAYYRIDPTQLTDMHAALDEVGILYVSSGCHLGWDEGRRARAAARPSSFAQVWEVPVRGGEAEHPGHAFAIVGYNERGFLIQNSWGPAWGSHGLAVMTYPDWLANAMDCWVAQLGVVTQDHRDLARADTLRTDRRSGRVQLSASPVLRQREISPFVINIGNRGALAASGIFRTTPDDVRAIAELQLARARADWKPRDGVVDVCVIAHGGLDDEAIAGQTAARLIPPLYDAQVFPVFLMWETQFGGALRQLLAEVDQGRQQHPSHNRAQDQAADAAMHRRWNARLENALAPAGTALWRELKESADAISLYRPRVADDRQAGAVLLYRHFKHQVQDKAVRMHLVAHSAGAIVASLMMDRLVADGVLSFDSVTFLAPAVRCDTFAQTVAPLLRDGRIRRYQQFSLSARAEEDDPSCAPYRRSLLHLVAGALEGGARQPILGLEADARAALKGLPNTKLHLAPGRFSEASTHGGFDADLLTLKQVLRFIRQRR